MADEPIQVRFQPTLFIFLGTSSGQIGWRLRKLLQRAYGDVPVLRYLWIDIDSAIDPRARPFFTPAERIELSGFSPAAVVQNIENYPTLKEWWPNAEVPAGMLSGGGSLQQMRLLGRLALFRKFNDRSRGPAFIDKLNAAVDALFEIDNIRATEAKSTAKTVYAVEEGCRVVMVFSPCGGTGSALSFDVAYLCRKLLQDKEPRVMSIGVLPPVIDRAIKGETHTQREKVRANAYAWFREDNYLTEHPYWEVRYPEGATVVVPAPPFDYRFVVDMENEANYRLNSTDDVYNMIAQALFMDTGSSVAGEMRGFTANVSALREPFEGVTRSFSSLAAASLVFPKERLLDYCSHHLASALLSEGLIGTPERHHVDVSASTLLGELHLRDTELIPALTAVAKAKMQREPAITKADSVATAAGEIDGQEKENEVVRRTEAEKVVKFAETRLKELKASLDKELANRAATFGFGFAIAVIDKLLEPAPPGEVPPEVASLDGLRARIAQQGCTESDVNAQREGYKNSRMALRRLDDGLEDKLERAVNLKGWQKKFALLKRDCVTDMAKVNDGVVEMAAQQQASNIYDQLAAHCAVLKAALDSSATAIRVLADELETTSKGLASKEAAEAQTYEFMQEIDVDFSSYYRDHSREIKPSAIFQDMIPAQALATTKDLTAWVADELGSAALAYGGRYYGPGLEATSLLNVLKTIAEKRGVAPQKLVGERLDALVQYCQPFWQYDHNRGLHDMEGKSIIGVENETSPLIPPQFRNDQLYEIKTTGFLDRIDVVRVQHGLPAFLLRGMDEYKEVYEKKRKQKRDPLHVLPGMDLAPELAPEEGKEFREMFAIGLAFNYIVQVGSWYYFDPARAYVRKKIQPTREFRLAQGREKAEDVFARREEWAKQVDDKFEEEVQENGNAWAISKLQEAIESHEGVIAKMTIDDPLRKQYEKEIRAFQAEQSRLGKVV